MKKQWQVMAWVAPAALAGAGGALLAALIAGNVGSARNEIAILIVIATYTVLASIICIARPGQRVGRLMLLGACLWGVGEGMLALGIQGYVHDPGSVAGAPWLGVLGTMSRGIGWLVLVVAVPMVFPDGRTPWPGRRIAGFMVGAGIAGFALATLLSPTPLEFRLDGMDSPTGLPDRLTGVADGLALGSLAIVAIAIGFAVAGLIHRWRTGDELRRQQLLWFALAFAPPIALLPFVATPVVQPWMFAIILLPVPVAIGVALLQQRLYDIPFVINRTLTYSLLSLTVATLYAVTVGGVGALLSQGGAPWLGWAAAGVVAVSFAPLRNSLQRTANRVTYGQWAQPADVLAATGRRLADANNTPGLLSTLTEEIATGLGLRHVAVTDENGSHLASYGSASGSTAESLALTAYGRVIGALSWTGPPLRDSERKLLQDVANQIGGVVYSAGLLDSIRDAQERLVIGREEERRRLRRDLHDGLGTELAAISLQIDTLRNRAGADGVDLDREMVRLRSGIQSTVRDVRRIVEGLRPPAIDELGLQGALHQLTSRLARDSELWVDLDIEPLPPMSAAAEVAIYRVTQEAVINILRHSGAGQAAVSLRRGDGTVDLVVSDDGNGNARFRDGGVGLTSMRERADEIGGTLVLKSMPAHGTRVEMTLPLGHRAPQEGTGP